MKRTVRPILVFKGQHHFVERNHTLFEGGISKQLVSERYAVRAKVSIWFNPSKNGSAYLKQNEFLTNTIVSTHCSF
jgi:hypothetical protein